MSKKKNFMEGYFDQFKDDVADINPHIAEMVRAANKTEIPSTQETHLGDVVITDHNVAPSVFSEIEKIKTQPERSDKGGQNEVITEPKRSQQPGQNVAIEMTFLGGDPTLLVGTQRQVFKYFFELTRKFASLKTPRLTMDSMSAATGLRETQIHSATKQLRQKNCIVLSGRKDGRGGWVEYSVTQLSFDLWTRLENEQKRSQNEVITELKPSQQPGHKAIHEAPCSSSNFNINNTTTTEEIWLNVPERLQGQLPINQLRAMLKTGAISQNIMEDSLWGFAYDLENGLVKSKTGNTTGLFIGSLKNGGYISQKYLEIKQKEAQELQERLEEFNQFRNGIEASKLSEEFESFRARFPDEAEKMKPMSSYLKNFELGSLGYKMWLEEYKKTQAAQQNTNLAEAQL